MDMPASQEEDWFLEAHGISLTELRALRAGTRVSRPCDQGTPEAALVEAIWTEDLQTCQHILDTNHDLLNVNLKQWAYLRNPNFHYDSPYASGFEECHRYLQDLPPVVFAVLLPRFKQDRETRAISESNLALVRFFYERGAGLDIFWKSRILPEVCWNYDSNEVLDILIGMGADLRSCGGSEEPYESWSLLQLAARRGSCITVDYLINKGVPLGPNHTKHDDPEEARLYYEGTPLNSAAEAGHDHVAELLLRRGAAKFWDEEDDWGNVTLHIAANPGTRRRKDGSTEDPRYGSREKMIQMLIDAGAKVGSILERIVGWGSPDIIRHVVQNGGDIHQKMEVPARASTWAGYSTSWVDFPYPWNAGGKEVSLLHVAAQNGKTPAVETLIELGADINALDDHGRSALHWATMGHVSKYSQIDYGRGERLITVHPIFEYDRQTHPRQWKRATVLAKLEATIKCLLSHGAYIDIQDRLGRTPLHYAVRYFNYRMILLLMNRGADPTLDANKDGLTIFHELAVPADINLEVYDRLHLFPEPLYEELYEQLRDKFQDTGIIDRKFKGQTALHMACGNVWVPMTSLLLRLGADPNIPDDSGLTPLGRATSQAPSFDKGFSRMAFDLWIHRYKRVRALLLEAGAQAETPDINEVVMRKEFELESDEYRARRRAWEERHLLCIAQGRGRGAGPPPDRGGFDHSDAEAARLRLDWR